MQLVHTVRVEVRERHNEYGINFPGTLVLGARDVNFALPYVCSQVRWPALVAEVMLTRQDGRVEDGIAQLFETHPAVQVTAHSSLALSWDEHKVVTWPLKQNTHLTWLIQYLKRNIDEYKRSSSWDVKSV